MRLQIRMIALALLVGLFLAQPARAQVRDLPPVTLLASDEYNYFTRVTLTPTDWEWDTGLVLEVEIWAEATMALRHQLHNDRFGTWFPGDSGKLMIDAYPHPVANPPEVPIEIDPGDRRQWENSTYYYALDLSGGATVDLRMEDGPNGLSSVRNIASAKLVRAEPYLLFWGDENKYQYYRVRHVTNDEVILPVPTEVSAYVGRQVTQSIPQGVKDYPMSLPPTPKFWASVTYQNVSHRDHYVRLYYLDRKFPPTWKLFVPDDGVTDVLAEAGTSGLRTFSTLALMLPQGGYQELRAVIYPAGSPPPVPPPYQGVQPTPMPESYLELH